MEGAGEGTWNRVIRRRFRLVLCLDLRQRLYDVRILSRVYFHPYRRSFSVSFRLTDDLVNTGWKLSSSSCFSDCLVAQSKRRQKGSRTRRKIHDVTFLQLQQEHPALMEELFHSSASKFRSRLRSVMRLFHKRSAVPNAAANCFSVGRSA